MSSVILSFSFFINKQGVANKNLLYSTGNSTEHSNGLYGKKNLKKGAGICLCITGSLCCIPEINTTLYINYIPIKISKKDKEGKSTEPNGQGERKELQDIL